MNIQIQIDTETGEVEVFKNNTIYDDVKQVGEKLRDGERLAPEDFAAWRRITHRLGIHRGDDHGLVRR